MDIIAKCHDNYFVQANIKVDSCIIWIIEYVDQLNSSDKVFVVESLRPTDTEVGFYANYRQHCGYIFNVCL